MDARYEYFYSRSERFLSSFWSRVFFPAEWHRSEFRNAINLAYAQGRADQAAEHYESTNAYYKRLLNEQ